MLAGAIVTYGGVSLFVAFFVVAPMVHQLFRSSGIPRRLMSGAVALGTTTFCLSALPGTPAIQNAIPIPFFGATPFRDAGARDHRRDCDVRLRHAAARESRIARMRNGRGLRARATGRRWLKRTRLRISWCERASPPRARSFPGSDPRGSRRLRSPDRGHDAAAHHRRRSQSPDALFVLPRMDAGFLAKPEWNSTSLSAVGGVAAVVTAVAVAILVLTTINSRRLPALRDCMDAGAKASVLAAPSVVASLGRLRFGRGRAAGVCGGARLSARDRGRPSGVSLAVASNVLAH